MKKIRLVYRLLFFISCAFILISFNALMFIFIKNKVKRQKKISNLAHFLSKKLMKAMGFKITVEGLQHLQKNQNYLIVANHVSYIDITLMYSFIQNNRFISHYEWKENSPFLHLILNGANVYFVERRNLKNIRKELREITDILKKGLHLVFFPEGTSTDGSEIRAFHPLFFAAAISAKKSILPCCISYTKVNNEVWNIKNREFICWYDTDTKASPGFTAHLLQCLQLQSIEANIQFLPPLSSEGKNSRTLAEESREQIQKNLLLPNPFKFFDSNYFFQKLLSSLNPQSGDVPHQ